MIIKRHYKDHLEALHRLSAVIRSASSPEEVFPLVLEEIAAVLCVERASIMRYDPVAQVLRVVAAKGIDPEIWKEIAVPVGEGVAGRVFLEKNPVLVKKIERSLGTEPKTDYKTASFMAAPLKMFPMQVGETPIGVINVTDKTDRSSFSERDLQLLTIIADQVATYLHLQQVGRAHHQLEMARLIQERLLPKKAPKIPGLEIVARLIPAERVGADYYDFLNSGKTLGVAVADVSGHDVGGALLAQELKTCFRIKAEEGLTPAHLMRVVNLFLYDDFVSSEQFASLFFGTVDPKSRVLSYTNAGHNPPLVCRGDGGTEWLYTNDSLLGIEPQAIYHEKSVSLEVGDVVVFYTDGLVETEGEGGRFGQERLQQLVSANRQKPASALLDTIFAEWNHFSRNRPARDDVTLVVLSLRGVNHGSSAVSKNL